MANFEARQWDQEQLVDAWRRTLPEMIHDGDSCEVIRDEADEKSIRVTIRCAGHQMYEFDFKVAYVDDREVAVQLIDAEKDNVAIDERTDTLQQLIRDYTRHLHECAQALRQLTHA